MMFVEFLNRSFFRILNAAKLMPAFKLEILPYAEREINLVWYVDVVARGLLPIFKVTDLDESTRV